MSGQSPTADEIQQAARWEKLEAALREHYHEPELGAVRALCSAFAAHTLSGPPVWPMLIAPPGSMKTDLVKALDGLPKVHLIDTVTPHTFLSGQIDDPKKKGKVPPSLLHRIGPDGIMVCADFGTVISMNRDCRASVLADLRRIYDGQLRQEFGTDENLKKHEWRGRITFIAAATPDVDVHYGIFQTLGERFLMVRWHRPGGINAALKAMNQNGKLAEKELKEAVHALLQTVPTSEPRLPEELQRKLAALSEFVVRARTHVPRNGYSKDIVYVPEPEAATRLAQQVAQLTKGSAVLAGRPVADEEDYSVALRAGRDCIPATRAKILDALIARGNIKRVNLPASTLYYAIEELKSQELIAGASLSPLARDLLLQAGIL